MSLMLSTKLSSFKSSNPKQITSQRTKRNVFLVPSNSQKSAHSVLIRVPHLFASEFSFQPTQNAEFQFLFVACQLHDECSTNRSEAGKKHHSSCLCLATKAQRTAMRNFPFCSFVPCLACPMFSLTLFHLSTSSYKRERGLMNFKNYFHTNITPNFTKIYIFQFLLFPMCIYVFLNYLSPKIMYIQGKLRWNMSNYGVYQVPSI